MKRSFALFNTASLAKETVDAPGGKIGMYCCGPTVYNYAHIGNLRTYVFEDVLRRALESLGICVTHVVNITDVGHLTSDEDTGEDKMEKGARREGRSVWDVARHYTGAFMRDIGDLHVLGAHVWPRATEHIPEMISQVKALEEKGFTYRITDGIYFDTTKFGRYCAFARLDPDSLRAGARVDMGEKRSPTDFALWKFSPPDVRRQMEWESPWGRGFPGWHIECSAMSLKYLPQPVDIHCGGMDHVRVHHTNEIAQAEAATGRQFVRFWAHGEFLTMTDAKMAKSGENFVTLDTVKSRGTDPLAFRMLCYSAHYRSPLAFSWEGLESSAHSLANLRRLAAQQDGGGGADGADETAVQRCLEPFYAAVDDDLNMPKALAAVWSVARSKDIPAPVRRSSLARADAVLALDLMRVPREESRVLTDDTGTIRVFVPQGADMDTGGIVAKIRERRDARAAKDFKRADAIRNELARDGADIKDMPDGTTECVITIIKKE
jgi:cysteinyl-tRNA synthetase